MIISRCISGLFLGFTRPVRGRPAARALPAATVRAGHADVDRTAPFRPPADSHLDRNTFHEQDGRIGKAGHEINFNREFFPYRPPRPPAEIDAEPEAVEKPIMGLLREVTE